MVSRKIFFYDFKHLNMVLKALKYWIFVFLFFMILWFYHVDMQQSYIKTTHVRYLSYIPPLELNAIHEGIVAVSLKKIDFFKEDTFLESERFLPIIDKVLVIPPQYSYLHHEFRS